MSFFVVADFCLFFWEAIITTQRYFAVVVVPLLGKLLSSDFAIFTSPGPAAMSSMTFFFCFRPRLNLKAILKGDSHR